MQPASVRRSPNWRRLLVAILHNAIVLGETKLSSGGTTDRYLDLRRVTLHSISARQLGYVMLQLLEDLDYHAVGGPTLGADPVAAAIINQAGAQGIELDAFIVRKAPKAHGTAQRIEGPPIAGRRVVVIEDTCTAGGSVLEAVAAVREAGAQVLCVAVVVDRGGRAAVEQAGIEFRALFTTKDLGLE